MSRWALFGVIFICIFELLNRRFIGNASFSGIQITRLNFLAYFLPPAVAFCVVNIFALEDEETHYGYIMIALAKQKLPGLYASEIHLLFINASGFFSSGIPATFTTRLGKFNNSWYEGLQIFLVCIGYLAFEVYAYTQLFRHAMSFNVAALISLLVTVLFIIIAVLYMIAFVMDPIPVSSEA